VVVLGCGVVSASVERGRKVGSVRDMLVSDEVTEVSDSFRLDRGGGGFMPEPDEVDADVEDDESVGSGGGGNSFRIEEVRSGPRLDADDGDLLGAGGAGGNVLLIEEPLSSDFFSSGMTLLF